MNILFLGAPGSGKGTQSKNIENEFNIPQISTGDLLRTETSSGSELGEELKKIMSSGKLVSDDILNSIVSSILTSKLDRGLVLKRAVFNQCLELYPHLEWEGLMNRINKLNRFNKKNIDYEVISMGHRNPQGLFYNEDKNFLLEAEHGPQGGDEINPDSLRYNFDTKKALIWNSRTTQNEMIVFSSATKKQNDGKY